MLLISSIRVQQALIDKYVFELYSGKVKKQFVNAYLYRIVQLEQKLLKLANAANNERFRIETNAYFRVLGKPCSLRSFDI
jgi:hypothetical protein